MSSGLLATAVAAMVTVFSADGEGGMKRRRGRWTQRRWMRKDTVCSPPEPSRMGWCPCSSRAASAATPRPAAQRACAQGPIRARLAPSGSRDADTGRKGLSMGTVSAASRDAGEPTTRTSHPSKWADSIEAGQQSLRGGGSSIQPLPLARHRSAATCILAWIELATQRLSSSDRSVFIRASQWCVWCRSTWLSVTLS